MKVFISWSGERSREEAVRLRGLVEDCLAPVRAWVSSVDMQAGVSWYEELQRELEGARMGIVCVTRENSASPWVLFECGALLKTGRLCPYLIDIAPSELQGPLAQQQAVVADREGTFRLLEAINTSCDRLITYEVLRNRFNAIFDPDHGLGIVGVYPNRAEGYAEFAKYIQSEFTPSGRRGRFWMVGSSLQGFDVGTNAELTLDIAVKQALERGLPTDCLHILMTHPDVAHYRDDPDGKHPGQIASEIEGGMRKLARLGVPQACLRLYRGTPTVSAIATSDRMLLNPYPYARPSHRCFSLIVRDTGNPDDIFQQYLDAHFRRGWELAEAPPAIYRTWLKQRANGSSNARQMRTAVRGDGSRTRKTNGRRLTHTLRRAAREK